MQQQARFCDLWLHNVMINIWRSSGVFVFALTIVWLKSIKMKDTTCLFATHTTIVMCLPPLVIMGNMETSLANLLGFYSFTVLLIWRWTDYWLCNYDIPPTFGSSQWLYRQIIQLITEQPKSRFYKRLHWLWQFHIKATVGK